MYLSYAKYFTKLEYGLVSTGQSDHIIFWGEKGQSEAQGAHRKMVTFLRQNLSRIFFSFTDKVMAMTLIHEKIKQKYYFKKITAIWSTYYI